MQQTCASFRWMHRRYASTVLALSPSLGRTSRIVTAACRQQSNKTSVHVASALISEQQDKVERLHRHLLRVSFGEISERERANLWHAYLELRTGGNASLALVSHSGWSKLWKLQTSVHSMNLEDLQRLQLLVDDMQAVHVDSIRSAQILRIERYAFAKDIDNAVRVWLQGPNQSSSQELMVSPTSLTVDASSGPAGLPSELKSHLRRRIVDYAHDQDWLQLGIKLFGLMSSGSNAAAASMAMLQVARLATKLDPQSAMSIVEIMTRTGDAEQVEEAWNAFNVSLRTSAQKWTFSELDAVCNSFLVAERLPYACSVLFLMAGKGEKSPAQIRQVFAFLHKRILSKVQSIEEIDNISLELLRHLPDAPVQDSFFGNWLRASNRFEDTVRTSRIIELMFERGHSPRARHIDRLLHSWTGSPTINKPKEVESIALSMISKRLENVTSTVDLTDNTRYSSPRLPKYLKRALPAADSRTFVLLMKHYAKLGEVDAVRQTLRLLMHTPGLILDSHLSRVVLAIHFIMGDVKGAWRVFELMQTDNNLQCDLSTAAVLWKGVNMNLAVNKTRNRDGFPEPRQLFSIMLREFAKVTDLTELPVPDLPPDSLYERIVHCFCLAEDTPGLILALHVMKAVFNMNPTQKTVLSVAQHIAHRRAWKLNADDRANTFQGNIQRQTLESVTILQHLWKRMQDVEPSERLPRYPGVFEKPKPSLTRPRRDFEQAHGEELLLLLTLFVKDYLSLDRGLGRRFEDAIDTARAEMNIADYPPIDAKVVDLRYLSS